MRQKPTPEPLAEDRQPATFMIGQSQSSPAQLPLQHPVFGSEVLQELLLLALHPPTTTARISCSGITR